LCGNDSVLGQRIRPVEDSGTHYRQRGWRLRGEAIGTFKGKWELQGFVNDLEEMLEKTEVLEGEVKQLRGEKSGYYRVEEVEGGGSEVQQLLG